MDIGAIFGGICAAIGVFTAVYYILGFTIGLIFYCIRVLLSFSFRMCGVRLSEDKKDSYAKIGLAIFAVLVVFIVYMVVANQLWGHSTESAPCCGFSPLLSRLSVIYL